MLFRFLFLVLLVGGAFGYYRFYADEATKTTVQEFVSNFTENTSEKVEELLDQKEILQAKLVDLQAQVTETAEAGVDKYEEVSTKIQTTKDAIEELDRSLKDLKGSVGLGEED